jgi:hypothetical protein
MQATADKYKVNAQKTWKFDVTSFLQRFTMYKGIQQFYLHDIKKEQKRQELRLKRKPELRADLPKKEVGQTSKDQTLVQHISCDQSWVTCFFDFTHMGAVSDHFVFRVGKNLQSMVRDDYFQEHDIKDIEETTLRGRDDGEEHKALVPAASPHRFKT